MWWSDMDDVRGLKNPAIEKVGGTALSCLLYGHSLARIVEEHRTERGAGQHSRIVMGRVALGRMWEASALAHVTARWRGVRPWLPPVTLCPTR